MSFYPLFTLEKNKYNIWKKSCQYSISQDTEGGNSTCHEILSRLARKLNPPHTLYNKRIKIYETQFFSNKNSPFYRYIIKTTKYMSYRKR